MHFYKNTHIPPQYGSTIYVEKINFPTYKCVCIVCWLDLAKIPRANF